MWAESIITIVLAFIVMYFMVDRKKLLFSPWHLIWILPAVVVVCIALMALVAGSLATPTGIYW